MNPEKIKIYEDIISLTPDVELKGKNMLYTSANGYMFSMINKDSEIGIRLPKEVGKEFMVKYMTGEFRSYGAKMKDYVLIPETLLNDTRLVASFLRQGYEYVMTLKSK